MSRSEAKSGLQCMEIVGGNRTASQAIRVPGLDIWVESIPVEGDVGGDIHYFSLCGSGRVTRLVVADVAGHGAASDELAARLRRMIRKHINHLDQRRLARDINEELAEHMDQTKDSRFATVAFLTYFAPTDHLIICNAGHPAPIWFNRRSEQWRRLEPGVPDPGPPLSDEDARYAGKPVANLPLGVVKGTEYVQFAVKLSKYEVVVAYTDGLIEAQDETGRMLGQEGLLRAAEVTGPDGEPEAIARRLLSKVQAHRGGGAIEDDSTLAVIRHSADDAPPITLGRIARVLPKALGFRRI
jgi:serine phosphatase RsbU (regulator of sigma subunit)